MANSHAHKYEIPRSRQTWHLPLNLYSVNLPGGGREDVANSHAHRYEIPRSLQTCQLPLNIYSVNLPGGGGGKMWQIRTLIGRKFLGPYKNGSGFYRVSE